MIRFFTTIALHVPLALKYMIRMKKMSKSTTLSVQEKYDYGRECIKKITDIGKITVNVYGLENLPKEDGYVMYCNHQGRFDALAVVNSHEHHLAAVIDETKSHTPLFTQYIELTSCKRLKRDDPRQGIRLFNEIAAEIKETKQNYLIFPEGQYGDNHNTLQPFFTGCMKFVYKVGCPIIPIALYDTYKVYGVNSLKKVACEVHYLAPITYDVYKDLSKSELSDLIKNRMETKLSELRNRQTV